MLCLGIESSCHTFGIGIVRDDGKILSNTKSVYKPKKGGIIPREAAQHHCEKAKEILERSLKEAKVKLFDIDLISFAAGPGMPPALRVGAVFARSLSLKLKKPIVPVSHSIAHVEIGKLTTGLKDPIVLYVSGGNTLILAFTGGRYREFGSTQDTPVGAMLDKFARELGIAHPGGPAIEKLAKKGKYIELPYVVKGMDVSFSGILTAALQKKAKKEDLCFSLQETCFAMLTEVCERAMAHTGKKELLLTGGVAANKRLQEMLEIMCEERGARFAVVPAQLSGDCGANIAWAGFLTKPVKLKDTKINRFWRADDVELE